MASSASSHPEIRQVNRSLSVEEIDEIYRQERDKRLREDGTAQYVSLHEVQHIDQFQDDPWYDPNAPDGSAKLGDVSQSEIFILGAGHAGLLFAVRLIEAGFKAEDLLISDPASGFGGTWYWNRYPGLTCDIESYIYMPLLEETGYMPSEKYAPGWELREHSERIADKWHLRERALLRTRVTSV
jgi:hypothetical protein